jgi:hypothetical protein
MNCAEFCRCSKTLFTEPKSFLFLYGQFFHSFAKHDTPYPLSFRYNCRRLRFSYTKPAEQRVRSFTTRQGDTHVMTERPPSSPPSSPQPESAPSSPLRSARPALPARVTRATSPPPPPPPPPPPSQPPTQQLRETGLIAWIEDIRATLRRENEVFRENLLRENEIWKANMHRELREEMRRLVVEKFIADNKPSSSSDTSSLHALEDPVAARPPTISGSDEPSPSPISPLTPTIPFSHEFPTAGPSTMPPPPVPSTSRHIPRQVLASTPRRVQRLPSAGPTPFVLPRKPRIGSYYAVIVDTDGDDPDGALLAHMIEIATFRPGFLFSHTGTPEPHRDCCATLYFATLGNVHDWMHDVNGAYRLDNQEIERLEQNSGELKRKRRFDMYVRICKVEAEDPWEIFERRR